MLAHVAPALAGLGGSVVVHDPSSHLHHAAGAAGAVRLSELGDLLASVLGVRSAAPRAAALPVADLLHRPATNLLVTVDGFPSDVDGALASDGAAGSEVSKGARWRSPKTSS